MTLCHMPWIFFLEPFTECAHPVRIRTDTTQVRTACMVVSLLTTRMNFNSMEKENGKNTKDGTLVVFGTIPSHLCASTITSMTPRTHDDHMLRAGPCSRLTDNKLTRVDCVLKLRKEKREKRKENEEKQQQKQEEQQTLKQLKKSRI